MQKQHGPLAGRSCLFSASAASAGEDGGVGGTGGDDNGGVGSGGLDISVTGFGKATSSGLVSVGSSATSAPPTRRPKLRIFGK